MKYETLFKLIKELAIEFKKGHVSSEAFDAQLMRYLERWGG